MDGGEGLVMEEALESLEKMIIFVFFEVFQDFYIFSPTLSTSFDPWQYIPRHNKSNIAQITNMHDTPQTSCHEDMAYLQVCVCAQG